jgi:hypothetical protein
MSVRVVSAFTGTDSIDVLEDRGSAIFSSRSEAEDYLEKCNFDASLSIVEDDCAL